MGAYDFDHAVDIAWCPGCGNFRILESVKDALDELELDPANVVFVSGIGQAAKTPQYLNAHYFNGLHGRTLPPATAIKASNPELIVIAESGDGDMYGEGGNHFMHTIRRNPDITNIVHNNMVYALTKGQASPTTRQGFVTPVQVHGVTQEPFNPVAVAIALDASFVARAFAGDARQTTDLIKKAITHKGYALVDIFQPCVTYNKVNTYGWFKQNTYTLEESYDPTDREAAFRKATEPGKFPLGVLYIKEGKPTFEEGFSLYRQDARPLYQRTVDMEMLRGLVDSMRT
jgi:2-oxoglutarate ferredoxin oxidoreductase subunit beta